MSQAMSFPVTDPFLLKYGTFLPQNREITVDPKWMTCDIVTAPGRFTYLNITEPRTPVINGQPGKPVFGGSIMLNPEGCSHVLQAIYAIAEKNWDPEQRIDPATGQPTKLTPSQLLTMGLPHGIGMPLVDGTTYWRNNRNPQKYELWRGLYVIGTNTPAETKGKPNAIICKDVRGERISPAAIKSGDYGRYMIRLYPTPRRGAQGYGTNRVCALLQGVQLMAPGEALSNFDADAAVGDAFANAGDINIDPTFLVSQNPTQQPGYAQPVGQVQGFAMPPQQQVQQPVQPQYQQPAMQPPAAMPVAQSGAPQGYVPSAAPEAQPGFAPGAHPGAPVPGQANAPQAPQMVYGGIAPPPPPQ